MTLRRFLDESDPSHAPRLGEAPEVAWLLAIAKILRAADAFQSLD